MSTLADSAQLMLADPSKATGIPRSQLASVLGNFARTRATLRSARRFSLSDEFVREAVVASSVDPVTLIGVAELARLPFSSVWIELDLNVRVDVQAAIGTSPKRRMDLGMAGFLLTCRGDDPSRWVAVRFQGSEFDGSFYRSMGMGLVNQALDPSIGRDRAYMESTRHMAAMDKFNDYVLDIRRTGWGYAEKALAKYGDVLDSIGGTLVDTVFAADGIMSLSKRGNTKNITAMVESVDRDARETEGDLRFLVTVLAMINVVPVEYRHVPPVGRKFTRNLKTMDYLDSSVITIRPGKKRVLNVLRAVAREYSRRKRHEVRGHWRIYHRGTPDEASVWIKNHERGDASLGFVVHEYEVKG